MISIVLMSHGDLGTAMIRAAEMIMGPAEQLFSVSLLPDEAPEGFSAKLSAALAGIAGQEILVLIDLFGGTPYNVAARLMLNNHCECVTGASLPMLLEVLCARESSSLEELAATAVQAGQDAVKNLGPLLRKSKVSETAGYTVCAGP